MIIRKTVSYSSLDINGEILSKQHLLELDILENLSSFLIHRDLLRQQISQKQRTISTKTRSEVRGGGKKPWRQKGTGRARAGSSRSPLWKGGGVVFGPKPRNIKTKLNKKERQLALRSLLYNKRNIISVIDDFEISFENDIKTKSFIKICNICKIDLTKKTLIIVDKKTFSLKLVTNNLKNINLICANQLNTLSLLKADQIITTPKALKVVKEVYCE